MSIRTSELNNEEVVDLNQITPEIWDMIEKVYPPTSPFDARNFDAVKYLNERFPDENSLENIEDEIKAVKQIVADSEEELRQCIYIQADQLSDSYPAIEQTELAIKSVVSDIDRLGEILNERQAEVDEVTKEIRELDTTKRNITNAIKTLSQLELLLTNLKQFESQLSERDTGSLVMTIQRLNLVTQYFEEFKEIEEIQKELSRFQTMKSKCRTVAFEEFRRLFSMSSTTRNAHDTKSICQLLGVLGSEQVAINWFIREHLNEYASNFSQSKEVCWIDHVDHRYTWLKRMLIDLEERQALPLEWDVPKKLSVEFCEQTRRELCALMRENKEKINVQLLKYVIERTTAFEILLNKMFPQNNPFEETQTYSFIGAISYGFSEFLDIYIESVKQDLSKSIQKFAAELRTMSFHTPAMDESQPIISSCADLFVFYRNCLQQLSKLGDDDTLITLASVFEQFLSQYCKSVLGQFAGKVVAEKSISISLTGYSKTERHKLSEQEIARLCCIVATSEYCSSTIVQLENKLKGKLPEERKQEVDLTKVVESYQGLIDECIGSLVNDLLQTCEQCLTTMTKINWGSYESVGDQSTYVNALMSHLAKAIPIVRQNLSSSRKHFTEYCIKFVNAFLPKYVDSLLKCKPLSIAAAEQLLLDAQSIKMEMVKLPSMGCTVARKSPVSLTESVTRWVTNAEALLKMVMSSAEPADAFVETYRRLLPNYDPKLFQKVLEMKGLKRNEQSKFTELYASTASEPSETEGSDALQQSSRTSKFETLMRNFTN